MDGCSRDEMLHRPINRYHARYRNEIHAFRHHHSLWNPFARWRLPFLDLGFRDSAGRRACRGLEIRMPASLPRQLVGRGIDASSRAMGTMSTSFLATSSRAHFCTLLVLYFGLLVPVLSFGIRQVIVQIDFPACVSSLPLASRLHDFLTMPPFIRLLFSGLAYVALCQASASASASAVEATTPTGCSFHLETGDNATPVGQLKNGQCRAGRALTQSMFTWFDGGFVDQRRRACFWTRTSLSGARLLPLPLLVSPD